MRKRKYIYLVRNESNGDVKIGHTNNLKTRLRTLQTANSAQLTIIYKFESEYYIEIENVLHEHFGIDRLLYGEWFNIGIIDILNIEEWVLKYEYNFRYIEESKQMFI